METIFALASAPGKAGVAIVRVSGPRAFDAASKMTDRPFEGRGMRLCKVKDLENELIDEALVLAFSAPASFTGENVVEFQMHGSPAIVNRCLKTLEAIEGLRSAQPGEFTRRALENGCLDLAQVEGLADLIEAETEAQRKQAQRVFSGALGEAVTRWRRDLVRAAALLEAVIDFADEEVPEDVSPEVKSLIQGVQNELNVERQGVRVAERIRNGFEVAIVGPPNVGKSTLLNALAGREAAITSEFAGTTRDVIEVRMDIDGLPVTLLDTAGLRKTDDLVEEIGIERALARADGADLRVFLAEQEEETALPIKENDIVVRPKADVRESMQGAVSGLTGQGIDELIARLSERLKDLSQGGGLAIRQRHAAAIEKATGYLNAAEAVLERGVDQYDIAAEELRSAIRTLEMLIGRIDVETLLDEIFSSFCLGK